MTVVFFGTSSFAVPILEALISTPWRPRVVVTAPDRPAGRGLKAGPSPVKQKAREFGLEVWEPARLTPYNKGKGLKDRLARSYDKPGGLSGEPRARRAGKHGDQENVEALSASAWAERMAALAPDLFILAAYGKIIPQTLLALPRAGSLNVHPSRLPYWRGPAPIQYAILNGDPVTGVTIMVMDEKIDHGPILAQSSVVITADDTSETLEKKLSVKGARLLLETLPAWLNGNITPTPQNHAEATYTRLLTKESGAIDWSTTAVDIDRRVRAFIPWPGSYTFWLKTRTKVRKVQRITIVRARPTERIESPRGKNQELGIVFSKDKRLFIATGDGALEILELQIEGKRIMSGREFLNGHRAILGTQLTNQIPDS
jgi:methionyl-tRNA formyltransferase